MGEPDRWSVRDAVTARLASFSDSEMRRLLDAGPPPRVGIGGSAHSFEVAGSPVFVKKITLPDVELDAGPGNTRNHFDLPPWYHYGVGAGSAGFNAWREIAIHERVNGWVVEDGGGAFPLLYHWRIVPDMSPLELSEADIARAVTFWAGSPAIEARLRALSAATTVVAVFVEHFPFVLPGWVKRQWAVGADDMAAAVRGAVDQLFSAAAQMSARGVVHFDTHRDNILATDRSLVVSDFGLAAAVDFDLDDVEREFLAVHTDHDLAYCAAEFTNAILHEVMAFPHVRARNEWLRRCAHTGATDGLPRSLTETVRRLAPSASLMNEFYWRLHGGDFQIEFPFTAVATSLNAARNSGRCAQGEPFDRSMGCG